MASSSGMSLCCPPTNQRISSEMLWGLPASWNTGLPSDFRCSDVWMWPLCPGQSLDHLAMNVAIMPLRCARILVNVLNSAPRSAASSASQYWIAASSTPGPGLGVQSLDGNAHVGAELQQLVIELRVHRRAQHRVTEEARRHGGEIAEALLAHRLRRLLEHEEFELGGGDGLVAQVVGFPDHAPQSGARADGLGLLRELAQEHDHVAFEGNAAAGLGHHAHRGIRVGRVPARVLHVVVELVVRIPAQHHVAEAEALVERGEKLVAAHVLTAQDAVVVEDTDLDVFELAFLDDAAGVGRGADVFGLHRRTLIYARPESMCRNGPD